MLEYLKLKQVGPSPIMELELASRINLITGDNGLGKSFLLDVAWWALTRSWARNLVVPQPPPAQPVITFRYRGKTGKPYEYKSSFIRESDQWSVKQSRPAIPGLVLYAQVDGGFSLWDPARNYWKKELPERPTSYLFTADEIWEGNDLCEGLIRDWAYWQLENGAAFKQFRKALNALSPSHSEKLEPGELRKISIDDSRKYPTLKMGYGQDVPVVHASAGMRRIIALVYLLVWAWQEHVEASKMLGNPPSNEIIFLIDEIEAHLHPQWQRSILPALIEVMAELTGHHDVKVQLIAATHSPLVLASAEPLFDMKKDAWFDLDLEQIEKNSKPKVQLRQREYVRHGEVSNWLTSNAFDLKSARSLQAEKAIEQARELLRKPFPLNKAEAEKADTSLRKAGLPDIDPFWVRWGAFMEEVRGEA